MEWCRENNLSLNVNNMKKLIVDLEKVESFKFLSVHISVNLKWSTHTDSVVKNAQPSLFNPKWLKKFGLAPQTIVIKILHRDT